MVLGVGELVAMESNSHTRIIRHTISLVMGLGCGYKQVKKYCVFSLQCLLRVIVCCRWNYILSCCVLPTDALHLVNGGDMTGGGMVVSLLLS